jgi:ABC-type transport system involved in multi-copper enzyme maturation permease subunit
MNAVSAVAWKEWRGFLHDRRLNGALFFLVLIMSVYMPWQAGGPTLLVGPLIAVFAGSYLLTWTAFNGERLSKTLTSLLAGPLGMGDIFLGKIAAVTLATYLLGLLGMALSVAVVWLRFDAVPSGQVLLAALVTLPVWGIVLSQLLGMTYMLFSNPFVLRLLMILLLTLVLGIGTGWQPTGFVLPSQAALIGAGAVLVVLLFFLAGRLDKERVARG